MSIATVKEVDYYKTQTESTLKNIWISRLFSFLFSCAQHTLKEDFMNEKSNDRIILRVKK